MMGFLGTGLETDPGAVMVYSGGRMTSFPTVAAAQAFLTMRPLRRQLYDADIIPPGPPDNQRVFFQRPKPAHEDWIEPTPLVVPPEFRGTLE